MGKRDCDEETAVAPSRVRELKLDVARGGGLVAVVAPSRVRELKLVFSVLIRAHKGRTLTGA